MSTESDELQKRSVHLSWLTRLRWAAMAGQATLIGGVAAALELRFAIGPLLALFAVQLAANAMAWIWVRRGAPVTSWTLTIFLTVDVLVFTGLLMATGGASNPFSFLFLVYIALAAVMLEPLQAWSLVTWSALGHGSLFFLGKDQAGAHEAHLGHGGGMIPGVDAAASPDAALRWHLLGMWLAYVVAAVFIVSFLQRLSAALTARDKALAHLQAEREREHRLASLGTLAAGAAHELSTPLSTIAVAASELAEGLQAGHGAELGPEARVIRDEVERCYNILEQLAVDAGTPAGDALEEVEPATLLQGALTKDADVERVKIQVREAAAVRLCVPPRLCRRALRGLVHNALKAGPEEVGVEVDREENEIVFRIEDRGEGMSEDVLSRASEPFFTTRKPGEGMGLGLFVARSVFESLGGSLVLRSRLGEGTVAEVRLPLAPAPCEGEKAA